MRVAPLVIAGAAVSGCGQKRMAEPDRVARGLEHARGDRRRKALCHQVVAQGGNELGPHRIGQAGRVQDELSSRGRESPEPRTDQVGQALRDLQQLVVLRAALQHPAQLEGIQRVATGRRVDSVEGRAVELERQVVPEESVGVHQCDRTEVDRGQPIRGQPCDQARPLCHPRTGRPTGGEEAERLGVQPADRELEDACRGLVEPRHVIDGEDERPVGRGPAQDVEHAEGHSERIRRRLDRRPEQGGLDRDALRLGQRRQVGIGEAVHEVDETGEREMSLDLDRS